MGVEIRRYRPDDGVFIAKNMRLSDRREVYYLAALKPLQALQVTASISEIAWTAHIDGRPILAFGICRRSTMSDVGMPWALGTDEADLQIAAYARHSLTFFKGVSAAFPVMENYALAENTKTLRWLKWMGFDMDEPAPYGCFGVPFVRFGRGL